MIHDIVTDFAIIFEGFSVSLTATQNVPLDAGINKPEPPPVRGCHVDALSAAFSVVNVPLLY